MGRRSEEPVKYLVIGQRASHRNLILVAGMPADGEIQLVKDTVPGHKALAGAAFLTGTAEKYHSPLFSILLQVFLYGNGRSHRSGSQQVMAAAVARLPLTYRHLFNALRLLGKAGKGIEFTQDAHHRLSMAKPAGKCCLDPGQIPLHRKALLLQELTEDLCGLKFLECSFRMIPDCIAGCTDHFPFPLDRL